MSIITTIATTIYTKGESIVHIKHFFDIEMFKGIGLTIQCTLKLCGICGYFNNPQLIYPKLIRMFWRNTQLKDWKIMSKVLGN